MTSRQWLEKLKERVKYRLISGGLELIQWCFPEEDGTRQQQQRAEISQRRSLQSVSKQQRLADNKSRVNSLSGYIPKPLI